jgi:DNA repair protein RadC
MHDHSASPERSSLTINLLLFIAFPVREEKVFSSLNNTGEEHLKGAEQPMVLTRNSTLAIRDSQDVATVFQDLLSLEDTIDRDKEHFYVMHVNARQQVHLVELVAIGTLNHAEIHPRETFRRAIVEGSYSIVVAHNHPTGDVTPSEADITLTRSLHEAGELLLIPLLDHIIFADRQALFSSFRENKTQSTLQTPRKK